MKIRKCYEQDNIMIDGYCNIKHLATGGNSFVYSAEKDGKMYAIKISNKLLMKKDLERYKEEVSFEKEQNCPYIVKIIEEGITTIKDKGNSLERHYYVMPLYSKSFRDLLNDSSISFQKMLKYYDNVCCALSYSHSFDNGRVKGVFHRDIKPENILYDSENDICLLSDFGIAHFNKIDSITTSKEKLANFQYAAPEQRNKNGKIGRHTDLFPMGLILNEIFTHNIPVGLKYKTISSAEPLLEKLDIVVEKMIVDDPFERVANIDNIRHKINYIMHEYVDMKEDVLDKVNELSNDTSIKKIMEKDIVIGNKYANIEKLPNGINLNYHYNILYKMEDKLLNSYFIIKQFDEMNRKMTYEVRDTESEMDIENWSQIDKDNFIDFRNQLIEFNTYKSVDIYKARILRMLRVLKEYHALEYIHDFNKKYIAFRDDNIENPILFCSKILFELKSRELFLSYNLYDFIESISPRSSSVVKSDFIFYKDKEPYINDILQLKYKFTYIEEGNYVTLLFDNLSCKNKIKQTVLEQKNTELNDYGDIDDVIKSFEQKNDYDYYCYMSTFMFYDILCKKILNEDFDF